MYENHYDGDVCPKFNGGNQNIINKYPHDNANKPPKQGKNNHLQANHPFYIIDVYGQYIIIV